MTHEELVTHYGTATKAAAELGYSKQALSHWKKSGIPFDVQYRVQIKTRGKLKAALPQRRNRAA